MTVLISKSSIYSFLLYRYNNRGKEWVDKGIASFKNVSFRLNKETLLSENTEQSGTFYPVRDSCNKKDDPQEQYVLTDALFYHATVSLSGDYINVTITNENSVIIDTQYPREMKRAYTMTDFNCDGKYSYMILRSSNRKDCQKKCQENNGEWSATEFTCTIQQYLSNLCFRVKEQHKTARYMVFVSLFFIIIWPCIMTMLVCCCSTCFAMVLLGAAKKSEDSDKAV